MANSNLQSDLCQNCTILVVNRHHSKGDTYQHLLQPETEVAYQILTEPGDGQILDLCQSHPIDVILLESYFPDTCGFESLAQLKVQMGEYCPPIVMIGRDDAEVAVQALKGGAADYLVRERLNSEKLCQALRKAMHSDRSQVIEQPTKPKVAVLFSNIHEQPAALRDRKQSPEELPESQKLYQAISNQALTGVAYSDLSGKLTLVNQKYCDITGYSAAELSQMRIQEITHPEDLPRHVELYNRLLADGTPFEIEKRYIRKDGSTVWVNNHVSAIRDHESKLQSMVAIVLDITERKQAEAALRKSEAKYRTLFESMDEGFCILQLIFDEKHQPIDYRFIEINPVFEQQTGMKNALGKTIRELVPNLEQFWFNIYGKVALTGEPTRFVNHAQSMGRWFDVNAFRIGEPHECKVAVLFNDITERKKSEQERERFLAVGSDLQVITGIDGYFHWVSPSFERLLGWTQEEMTSRPWTDFVYPNDINPSVSETESLFSGNKTFAFENRYRHKDGSYRWLLWNAQPYPDEQVIYGAAIDITDRKLMEVALRESEEQFRTMADHAPFMVWVTDSTGYCIYLSQSWYEFTGQTPESGLGFGWLNRTHPDDREAVKRIFLEANEQQVAFRLEYRLQGKDGEYIWAIDAANPWFGAEGQFKGYIGSVIDISDRKRAEAAIAADLRDTKLLRDLSARLTTEADTQVLYNEILAIAITLMHADAGSFQFLDNATQELLLLAAQGLSQKMAEYFNRVSTRFNTSCGIALTTGERSFVNFDVSQNDDPHGYRRMHLEAGLLCAQSTPLISRSGKLIGMVSTHWRTHHQPTERELRFLDLLARQAADLIEQRQDEAERKKLLEQEQAARQEAERANRIKDEFLAVLSHELRSPLNPILGWSKLLQTRKMDAAKTAQALATIERNAKLQTQLIDDLLDVARILRGKLSLNKTTVNLISTIKAAIEVVRTAAEAKSISLQSQLTESCWVSGDEVRLQQIIWNLLSNAIKFTPSGGQINIRLEQVESYAQVTIIDTGRGISPEFLPYIFESFRQEDTSITRQHGGLGLGLSIVKYLVDAHGGTITANSPGEGQGATFTVKLYSKMNPLSRS